MQLGEIVPQCVRDILPESVRETNIRLGTYQVAVMTGVRRWSGADLKGAARRFGDRYKRSRKSALAKVNRALAPYNVSVRVGRAGARHVLEWHIGPCAWCNGSGERHGSNVTLPCIHCKG